MAPFKIKDHTADVRLQISGRDQRELFEAALEGLMAIMTPQNRAPGSRKPASFAIEASDMESLLVDFLNEALYVMQTQKAALTGAEFSLLDPTSAQGIFSVAMVGSFTQEVKAATYHDVRITPQSDGSLETTIVLDI